MEIIFYRTPAGNSPPEAYIELLDAKTKKKVARALDRLEKEGFDLQRTSDIFSKVIDDIYELRVPPHGRVQHRFMCGKIFYAICILDAFLKKQQKLKQADINRSQDRLKELKKQWKT